MATIPDDDSYKEAWRALDLSDRRRIVRAVNKGDGVTKPREAALAVVTAQRQQSFWRWAWLFGPLVSLINLGAGWQAVLVNAALASGILAGLCIWRYRRAARAEEANRRVALGRTGKAGPKRDHTPRKGDDEVELPPDAKSVRPGAGEPKKPRRKRSGTAHPMPGRPSRGP